MPARGNNPGYPVTKPFPGSGSRWSNIGGKIGFAEYHMSLDAKKDDDD